MTDTDSDAVYTWAWQQQTIWSQAANKLKDKLFHIRSWTLGLVVSAAILATAASQVTEYHTLAGKVLAGVASFSAIVAAILQKQAGRDAVATWTQARSVSEAFKAQVYLYLTSAPPYATGDPDATLLARLDSVANAAANIRDRTIGIAPDPAKEPQARDVATYIDERVRGQIDYFTKQSATNTRCATIFRGIGTFLAVVAAVLSAVAAATDVHHLAPWLAVITTVTGAVAAEAAFRRHEALGNEYAQARAELESLLVEYNQAGATQDAGRRLVSATELVLSTQNTAWLASSISAATASEG